MKNMRKRPKRETEQIVPCSYPTMREGAILQTRSKAAQLHPQICRQNRHLAKAYGPRTSKIPPAPVEISTAGPRPNPRSGTMQFMQLAFAGSYDPSFADVDMSLCPHEVSCSRCSCSCWQPLPCIGCNLKTRGTKLPC